MSPDFCSRHAAIVIRIFFYQTSLFTAVVHYFTSIKNNTFLVDRNNFVIGKDNLIFPWPLDRLGEKSLQKSLSKEK
jgi:hypothetical protein